MPINSAWAAAAVASNSTLAALLGNTALLTNVSSGPVMYKNCVMHGRQQAAVSSGQSCEARSYDGGLADLSTTGAACMWLLMQTASVGLCRC